MRVVFSVKAKADLREIALFIARDSKTRAQSFARELREAAMALADAPRGFPLESGFEELGVRRRTYRNYLIFYVAKPDHVLIVHIAHGAREYEVELSLGAEN